MYTLLGITILLFNLYAITKTILSDAEIGRKYLWVFLICLLPLIGSVMWWFKGPKQPPL
ncbi:PLDc_N domain-containing protein [Alginatibacterium sediminis]|uniref:PLDc_N domain-containing protein n=1 Tax=Alginatibacterium sediminis TaxID=2164068 RepID=A0A420E7B6_9ALTE|nr:PLDc N-terminal domain-containing protein [Alginatibacterium sediminis]RKF14441.1 PLDc_N domain-containing protein [Alginatibacterium sediminis]